MSLLETLRTTAPFGFGLIDLDWRFVSVTPALAALSTLAVEEHRGRFVADVVPELWPQIEPVLASLVQSGRSVLTREFVGPCAAGPTRPAPG